MSKSTTREIIDCIFKEPAIKYELTEFETLGRPIHEILDIQAKTVGTGRDAGKTNYFLKSQVPFSLGKGEFQVYVDGGRSAPEEIVRQLWVYKLIHYYGYHPNDIGLEKSVQFGTEVGTKVADIIVYTDDTKETPKIIVDCKKSKRKDGIEQLKSYMNAKGAPVAEKDLLQLTEDRTRSVAEELGGIDGISAERIQIKSLDSVKKDDRPAALLNLEPIQ